MTAAEALIELERLLLPLEEQAVEGIVSVVRALVAGKQPAETAKRVAEELAFEVTIRS